MSGLRRAAAALYGLHQDDREVILSHLALCEQERLGAALAELEALGFARSIGMALNEYERAPVARSASASEAAEERSDTADAWVLRLSAADGGCVYRVLAGESASLVAEALGLASWPWAGTLLERLPHELRREVRDRMFCDVALAPARRAWLLETLCTRVEQAAVTPPDAPARTTKLRRWLPWRA